MDCAVIVPTISPASENPLLNLCSISVTILSNASFDILFLIYRLYGDNFNRIKLCSIYVGLYVTPSISFLFILIRVTNLSTCSNKYLGSKLLNDNNLYLTELFNIILSILIA